LIRLTVAGYSTRIGNGVTPEGLSMPALTGRTLARRIGASIVLAALLSLAAPALADGKLFARSPVPLDVDVPAQRGLVIVDEACERESLVVQPVVAAGASATADLAWVIPVPAKPEVRATGRNIFGELRYAASPEVVSTSELTPIVAAWLIAAACALAVYFRARALTGCLGVGLALFAAIAVALPGTIESRGRGPSHGADVTVHERKRAGVFDVTVLSGRSGGGVLEWLRSSGFAVGDAALPVLERHVEMGWFFVGATVARDAGASSVLTPLRLDFAIEKGRPFYPLALTGAGASGPLDLELWTAAPGRLGHPALRTRQSFTLEGHDLERLRARPSLAGVPFPAGPLRLTEMRAKLEPAAMREDLSLVMGGGELRTRLFAPEVRWVTLALVVLSVPLALSVWVLRREGEPRRGVGARLLVGALALAWLLPLRGQLGSLAGAEAPPPTYVNDSAVIGSLRTIAVAQALFREGDKDRDEVLDYATSLAELGAADLIDPVLAKGEKYGVRYEALPVADPQWEFGVVVRPHRPGFRTFAALPGGVRWALVLEPDGLPDEDDPRIGP
jgi:hypothetical protein